MMQNKTKFQTYNQQKWGGYEQAETASLYWNIRYTKGKFLMNDPLLQ